jgi:hypothetical protein
MDIHEHTRTVLGCRPKSTCKASAKHLPAAKKSALSSLRIHCKITDHPAQVTTIKRLDQGHLHPKLGPSQWEASTLEKEFFKQLLNSYSEHLHMSAQPVENACDNSIINEIIAIHSRLTIMLLNITVTVKLLQFFIISLKHSGVADL